VIEQRIERLGLRMRAGREFELVSPESDPRYKEYWKTYHRLTERKGVSPEYARVEMRRRNTLIGAMLMIKGEADGMLCGTFGTHALHLQYIDQVIGLRPACRHYAAMNALILPRPHGVHLRHLRHAGSRRRAHRRDDDARRRGNRRFGIAPKVALLSGSNFGSIELPSARKMQRALSSSPNARPSSRSRARCTATPRSRTRSATRSSRSSRMQGEANLLVMPTLDAANISFNLLKVASAENVTIGPILLGAARPVHILTPSATVRRIVNMTALAVADANAPRGQEQTLF
jgi:malate dehydrogenase (oxaloacetate-decarboxylating)(NADP+)